MSLLPMVSNQVKKFGGQEIVKTLMKYLIVPICTIPFSVVDVQMGQTLYSVKSAIFLKTVLFVMGSIIKNTIFSISHIQKKSMKKKWQNLLFGLTKA